MRGWGGGKYNRDNGLSISDVARQFAQKQQLSYLKFLSIHKYLAFYYAYKFDNCDMKELQIPIRKRQKLTTSIA